MILKQREAKAPEVGDYRIETKFAWFPTWVDDQKIWLMKYQNFYEYKEQWVTPFSLNIPAPFKIPVLCWVLIDQKTLIKEPERHYH